MKKKKSFIIVLLLLVAVGMGIGYSILSKQLKIEGTVNTAKDFDVAITGIKKIDTAGIEFSTGRGAGGPVTSGQVVEVAEPTYTSDTATFNVRMGINSSIMYAVSIKNGGNIDAVLKNVNIQVEGNQDIEVTPMMVHPEGIWLNRTETFDYIFEISYPFKDNMSEYGGATQITISFDSKQSTESSEAEVEQPVILFDNRDDMLSTLDHSNMFVVLAFNIGYYNYVPSISVDGGEFHRISESSVDDWSYGRTSEGGFVLNVPQSLKDSQYHSVKIKLVSDGGVGESNIIEAHLAL